MIELRQVTKAFGRKTILRGINLTVPLGGSLVIFGPNGAGKTTLIRMLAGLSRPSGGSVWIGGLDMAKHGQGIRRYLGFVSHAPLLYDSLTAEENLRFFARLYALSEPQVRIAALLAEVGLASRQHDLVRTYSRGMVQRLAIARALLHDPAVLLLDEPDTGLDPQAAEMLHTLLNRLSTSPALGTSSTEAPARTMVTITHSLERGLAIASQAMILANGRVVFESPTQGLSPTDFRPLYDRHVGSSQ